MGAMDERINAYMDRLGALHKSHYWSWGGVRDDGIVILNVWSDRTRTIDGKLYYNVSHKISAGKPGYKERMQHIARLASGSPGYMVMLRPTVMYQPEGERRHISGFRTDIIWPIVELRLHEDEFYIRIAEEPVLTKTIC